jgi:hypothetical protein
MSTTIEVEKRTAGEKFNIRGLKMKHKECCGGTIVAKVYYEDEDHGGGRILKKLPPDDDAYSNFHPMVELSCKRCSYQLNLNIATQATKIICTAIDGDKREIAKGVTVMRS